MWAPAYFIPWRCIFLVGTPRKGVQEKEILANVAKQGISSPGTLFAVLKDRHESG